LKKVFDYSVVLCKILHRRSIDLYEAVNTAEDIISEMKSLRQKDSFIANLESRFTAHKSIIGGLQCLIPADPTVGPTTKEIQSIKVLGEFYKEDLTKPLEELVPELRLWYRKLSHLNASERPTNVLGCIKSCCFDAFPNIFALLHIFLTLPVTTCTSKWSFTTLRRQKRTCEVRPVIPEWTGLHC